MSGSADGGGLPLNGPVVTAIQLRGACHCGGCRYTLDWPSAGPELPARRCNCSYCTRFDGTWISDPGALLTIETEHPDQLGRYRFGTRTADFLFCRTCGVTLFAACEIEGRERAVVNTHTLALPEGVRLQVSDSRFDSETVEQRLERRAARWIGAVAWRP